MQMMPYRGGSSPGRSGESLARVPIGTRPPDEYFLDDPDSQIKGDNGLNLEVDPREEPASPYNPEANPTNKSDYGPVPLEADPRVNPTGLPAPSVLDYILQSKMSAKYLTPEEIGIGSVPIEPINENDIVETQDGSGTPSQSPQGPIDEQSLVEIPEDDIEPITSDTPRKLEPSDFPQSLPPEDVPKTSIEDLVEESIKGYQTGDTVSDIQDQALKENEAYRNFTDTFRRKSTGWFMKSLSVLDNVLTLPRKVVDSSLMAFAQGKGPIEVAKAGIDALEEWDTSDPIRLREALFQAAINAGAGVASPEAIEEARNKANIMGEIGDFALDVVPTLNPLHPVQILFGKNGPAREAVTKAASKPIKWTGDAGLAIARSMLNIKDNKRLTHYIERFPKIQEMAETDFPKIAYRIADTIEDLQKRVWDKRDIALQLLDKSPDVSFYDLHKALNEAAETVAKGSGVPLSGKALESLPSIVDAERKILLENKRRLLSGMSPEQWAFSKNNAPPIPQGTSVVSGSLDPRTIKGMISDLDRRAVKLKNDFGPQNPNFRLLTSYRKNLDSILKPANPEYASAMEAVASDMSALDYITDRLGTQNRFDVSEGLTGKIKNAFDPDLVLRESGEAAAPKSLNAIRKLDEVMGTSFAQMGADRKLYEEVNSAVRQGSSAVNAGLYLANIATGGAVGSSMSGENNRGAGAAAGAVAGFAMAKAVETYGRVGMVKALTFVMKTKDMVSSVGKSAVSGSFLGKGLSQKIYEHMAPGIAAAVINRAANGDYEAFDDLGTARITELPLILQSEKAILNDPELTTKEKSEVIRSMRVEFLDKGYVSFSLGNDKVNTEESTKKRLIENRLLKPVVGGNN